MADLFDARLKMRLQESGGNSGQWGVLLNQTVTNIASVFGFGTHQLSNDADATLTLSDDGASLDALKSSYLKITSSVSLTATRTLQFSPNTFNQVKYIENATSGSQSITISQGSGANVTIESGATKVVYFDGAGSGAAVVDALANIDQGTAEFDTIKVATIQANDGTSAMTLSNSSGNVAFPANIDVDGTTNLDVVDIDSTLTVNGDSALTGGSSGSTVLTLTSNALADTPLMVFQRTGGAVAGKLAYEDTNTAISFGTTTAHELKLLANNTRAMQIDSGGDISFYDGSGNAGFFWNASAAALGIGTSSIDNKVNIQESALSGRSASNSNTSLTLEHATDTGIQFFSATQTQLRFGDAASTGAGSIIYNHGTDNLRLNTSSIITFEKGGSVKATIDSSGNVGIGCVPSHKLEIRNDVAASTDLDPTAIKLYNNSDGGSAIEFSNGVGGKSKISFGVTSTGAGTDDSYLSFSTGANAGLSEVARFDASGNFGIGTDSPSSYLAEGDDLVVANSAHSGITIASGTSHEGGIFFADGTSGSDRFRGMVRYSHASDYMQFYTAAGERMRIDSNGKVSIRSTGYTTDTDLNLLGDGLSIKNDKNGSNNNWSLIQNTATSNTANLAFTTGGGVALTLNHDTSATFGGTVGVGDSLFLNDGSTTRGRIELNSSDTDDIDIIAVSLGSNLKFHTVGTEVGRFDASGNLLVGCTSFGSVSTRGCQLGSGGTAVFNNHSDVPLYLNRTTSGVTTAAIIISFYRNDVQSGSVIVSQGGTPAFAAPSDIRLKNNVTDHESELTNLMALRTVRWDWKDETRGSGEGFVAQELEQTAWADLVSEGEDGYKIVSGLGAVETRLIKAIQEQQTLIETLQAEVAALKGA